MIRLRDYGLTVQEEHAAAEWFKAPRRKVSRQTVKNRLTAVMVALMVLAALGLFMSDHAKVRSAVCLANCGGEK